MVRTMTDPGGNIYLTQEGGARHTRYGENVFTHIQGQKVIHTFLVLHEGWEADNAGWVTEDGRVWTTSHGSRPQLARPGWLETQLAEAEQSVVGLKTATAIAHNRTRRRK